jgi:transcriptional regulator with XRE-family HTH domain
VLILKPTNLAPIEIKFLRKYLGWSGADFAAHMGSKPETISRWENGKLAMNAAADRLLRTMVAMRAPVQSYSLDVLKEITPKKNVKPLKVGLRLDASGWRAEAA